MFEKLLAFIILVRADVMTIEDYNICLDSLFLEDSENDFLIELEFASKNIDETQNLISEYAYKEHQHLQYDIFGEILFKKSRQCYNRNEYSIKEFSSKMYHVWQLLPEEISSTKPFFALSYAGDCLSYGCENQTRELYEEIFSYSWRN